MSFEPEAVRTFEHAGWQGAADRYQSSFAHATAPFVARLLDGAKIRRGARVLDVACGPGQAAAMAARRGAMAQGLDFSAAMVRVARAAHPEIIVTEGDAENLSYPDGSFDAVVSNFGMHHVPRPERALAECRRVLVADGRVAFTVWAAPSENLAWSLVFDAIRRHGDLRAANAPAPGGSFNQPEDCLRALEAAGFADCRADVVRADWLLPDARALIAALSAGTVRMAALIAAQKPSSLAAVVADIDSHAERYRRGDRLAIPIAAILAHGLRRA